MPLVGTRELSAFDSGPLVTQPVGEPWQLPGCGILQLMYEIDASAFTSLLPPALHPTVPPTVVLTVTNVPESPVGPFALAEARLGCRSGARPRGLSLAGFCSTQEATTALAARWGYPMKVAEVDLVKRYDRIVGSVRLAGRTLLETTLLNPEPIAGNDIQYLATLNTAKIERSGKTLSRLVQVDPDFAFRSADRGKPSLDVFEASAFNLAGAIPVWPISASYTVADITMPELRYLVDPARPPLTSVEQL